ncbi:MAG: HEAT repeat domain-containing protein, partial [Pyrinomonadaceae bacterium]
MNLSQQNFRIVIFYCGSLFISGQEAPAIHAAVNGHVNSEQQSTSAKSNSQHEEIEQSGILLESRQSRERIDAIHKLAAIATEESSRVAVKALRDSNPRVRGAAVHAVRFLPMSEVVALIVPLLKDKDEFVRRESCYALREIGEAGVDKSAAEPLIVLLLGDKRESVRAAAAVALGKIP